MTDTFGYNSPDLSYDHALMYDGAVLPIGNIVSGETFFFPTVIPGEAGVPPEVIPDVVIGRKKSHGGGRSRREEEYARIRAPFINISVSSVLTAVNEFDDLAISAKELRYSGEETPMKFGVEALRVDFVNSNLNVRSELVKNTPTEIGAQFLSSEMLNLEEDIYQSEYHSENDSDDIPFIIEGGNILIINDFHISAGLITNVNEGFIIKSEVVKLN
jgi:hypothetical protein